jgi:hypothetical protein
LLHNFYSFDHKSFLIYFRRLSIALLMPVILHNLNMILLLM